MEITKFTANWSFNMKKHTLITEKIYSYAMEHHGILFNAKERESLLYGYARAGGTSLKAVFNPLGLVITSRNTLFLRAKVKKGFGKGRTRVVRCKLL